MHDFFEEFKNIEQKNNKSFDRIDELSLKDIKAKFNSYRKSIKDALNSPTFKAISNTIRTKITQAMKGDIAAAKQELELYKSEMSDQQYKETKEIIDAVEQADKLKKASEKIGSNTDQEPEEDQQNEDPTLGIQKNNDGTFLVAGKNPARKITVLAGMSESMNYNWKTGKLSWLAEAKFVAEFISINFKTEQVQVFTGKWLDGEFKGINFVATDGVDTQFLGGTFNGSNFKCKNTSFKVSPTNFINGLFPYEAEGNWGGILGLPDVIIGEQSEPFHITQVGAGNIIKIVSSEGLNYPIKVLKRMDGRSSGFLFELLIEGDGGGKFSMKWSEMRSQWNNTLIATGKPLVLPFVNISKIQSVSIATDYDKEVETAREPKIFSISRDEFKLPEFVKTLQDNRISKFKVNIPDASKEAREFFKTFKSDVNAGKNRLENNLKVLKNSIGDQLHETVQPIQIEAYPEQYKWLKMVFLGSPIKPSGEDLNLDADEERALAYLNGFMKNIYTNIVDPNIKKGMLMAIRDYIGVTQIADDTESKPKEKEEKVPEKSPEDAKKLAKSFMIKEVRKILSKQDATFFDDNTL